MHLPFLSNPDVLHMGLSEVREESWLEIKPLRNSFRNKIELLKNFSHEILFENNEFQSANMNFFEALKTYLSTYYADEYTFKKESIDIYLGDFSNKINLIKKTDLELMSCLIPEDILILVPESENYILRSAAVFSPSNWDLKSKINKSLDIIHEPVPGYEKTLSTKVNSFLNRLPASRIFERFNWSIYPSEKLFFHPRYPDLINENNELFLRVERQTFRKLNDSSAIMFTIGVHNYPLMEVLKIKGAPESLMSAIKIMPESIEIYKGLDVIENAIKEEIYNYSSAK
tara:strand:+ start:1190 stop:2047 length:858 start_codon:yes stop_codon:yes gene_type:complete